MTVNISEVVPIGSTGKICLRHDVGISACCLQTNRLDWDQAFAQIPEIRTLGVKSVVLDVGAFIGDTTEIFLKHRCLVSAFEPQPDAFHCLTHNCPEAACFPIAVGNGEMVGLNPMTGNMGGRPLVPEGTIRTHRLDDLITGHIDFLKIDVEGYEVRVLDGARNMIAESRPIIHIEINPEALAIFGCKEEDIFDRLPDYRWRETMRCENHHWDLIGKPPSLSAK